MSYSENGEAAIVVQTEIPETPEKIEEETVSSEADVAIDESAEVEPVIESEPEPAKAKLDLPWHTIVRFLNIKLLIKDLYYLGQNSSRARKNIYDTCRTM